MPRFHRPTLLILAIVVLDAMGIGVVFPTLPGLVRLLLHGSGDVTRHFGFLLAVYAASMLFSSPILGSLSDRFGRRPLLLASLFGTAFDSLVMALAPTLAILYLGRTLAGITGANLTVATAYIADTTTEETRAPAFGRMNACFGIGFILGPALGGLVATWSIRAPFFLAAALNLLGALICLVALPESRQRPAAGLQPNPLKLNPFASFRAIGSLHGIVPLLFLFGVINLAGQIPAVLWVIYGVARFRWTPAIVGLSFAVFGLLHAVCQATLPQPAQRRLGERGTVLAGMVLDSIAFVVFSCARTSFAAFALIPLLSLGGVGAPALQAMFSNTAGEDQQGELQGVLTSSTSLIAIVGPLLASYTYELLQRRLPAYPGAIWLAIPLLYIPGYFILKPRAMSRTRETECAS
jgi:DHA1 family tetracycline resistance protein-like MFS transporter